MAGAVAELPQLSDSDLEEEEGDDRDRCLPPQSRLSVSISHPAGMHALFHSAPQAFSCMEWTSVKAPLQVCCSTTSRNWN